MIFLAKYSGHDGRFFIFKTKNKDIKMFASEVCVIEPHEQIIIDNMEKYIDKHFRILTYWNDYGFYVNYYDNQYYLMDAKTNKRVGIVYDSAGDIPATYNNMPVQKYQRRCIVGQVEIKGQTQSAPPVTNLEDDEVPF